MGKRVCKLSVNGVDYLFTKNEKKKLSKLHELDEKLSGKKKRDNRIKIGRMLTKANAYYRQTYSRTRQLHF